MKKKIAFIINSLATGGAEKTVASLINELHPQLEIHLLMFNTTNIEFKIPVEILTFQIGKPTSAEAGPAEVLKLPLQALKVKAYLKRHAIDLVVSFLNRPNFIAGYLKVFGFKGTTIINERTNTSYYYSTSTVGGRLGRFLIRKLYSRADTIITNSYFSKKDLQETYGLRNNILTINNGVNYQLVQQKLAESELPFIKMENEFIFCHVGRYHPDKNQALLLRAFAHLKNENCRLIMAGYQVPKNLGALVTQVGLQDKVILLERQSDVWPIYKLSDAFVLTSNVEGYPNVLLEAMACHLPIISTDCKWGPREILAPDTEYPAVMKEAEFAQNGILVPVGDQLNLANAMIALRTDDQLQQRYIQKTARAVAQFEDVKMIQLFIDNICLI